MRASAESTLARLRLNPCAGGASIPAPPAQGGQANTGGTSWPKVRCAATRKRRSRRRSGTRRRKAAPRSRRSRWPGSQPSPGRIPSARRAKRTTARRSPLQEDRLARARRGAAAAQKPALLRSNHPARRGMVGICFPRRAIADRGLIAPRHPSFARAAREQLEEWPPTARLDERVLLVRLARVLALARRQQIHLPPSRRQRARVLATHAEQNELGHVAEIEADPAPARPPILAPLVPDDVGLVAEAPCLHHREPVGQERVRAPQIEVRSRRGELVDRQRHDLRERHGAITRQAPVLGRDLSGLVDELPRRIGEDGAEAALADDVE